MDPSEASERSFPAPQQPARYTIIRTDASDAGFRSLVQELDKDLAIRDGEEHGFFAQYNKLDSIRHVVTVSVGALPIGCGAFKSFGDDAVEIKRMFTAPTHRQQGIGSLVLRELEQWACELGYRCCVLETGGKQPEAITLYTKRGYHVIPNYGQYIGVEGSVCFEKLI